jgi:hypothetical protein
VGAYTNDHRGTDSGAVCVFGDARGVWAQFTKLTADDGREGDYFGVCGSLYGDSALVGAPEDDDGGPKAGSAYMFRRSDGGWSRTVKGYAPGAAEGDKFGRSLALSGVIAMLRPLSDDDNGETTGSAFVFMRT